MAAAAAPAVASPLYAFKIPPGHVRQALIEATVTANGSLGGDLTRCDGESPGFTGRAALAEALHVILSRTPCSFRIGEDNTIVVRLNRETSPRPRRAPSAAAPAAAADVAVVVNGTRVTEGDALRARLHSRLEGDQLSIRRVQNVSSLSADVAGMSSTNLGPGRNKIIFRGVSDGVFPGEASATVAIFLANAPLNYVEKDPGLRLVDVESIEVIRSPQARTPNALGGAIVIQPNPPVMDTLGGSIAAFGSSASHGGRGYQTELVANAPLLPGRDAVRLVLYDDRAPGYIRDQLPSGAAATNTTTVQGGRISNRLKLTDRWSWDVTSAWQRLHQQDSQYVFESLSGFTRTNRVAEPSNNNAAYLISALSGSLAGVELGWTGVLSDHHIDSLYDATETLGVFGVSTTKPAAYQSNQRVRTVLNSVSASSKQGALRWRAALNAASVHDDEVSSLGLITAPGSPLYEDDRAARRTDISGYLGLTWRVFGGLQVDGSISPFDRRQWIEANAVRADGVIVGKRFTTSFKQKGIDPSVGVIWDPVESLILVARYSTGERPEGVNTGVLLAKRRAGLTPFQANRAYGGDKLEVFELGQQWRSDWWSTSVKLVEYWMNWKNVQADEFSIYNTPLTVNIGNGALRGGELEVRSVLPGDINLVALLGVEHGSLSDNVTKSYFSGAYGGLIGTPRYNGSLQISRRGTLGDLGWLWSATYFLQGPSRATFDGLTASDLRGFSTTDAAVEFKLHGFSLIANATNIFDQRGDTLAFGNPFSVQRGRQITPQRPREFSVGFRRAF